MKFKWELLPKWVRWLLYFPAILIVTAIATFAVHLPSIVNGHGVNENLLVIAISAVVASIATYWATLNLAPGGNKRVLSAIIYLVLGGLWFLTILRHGITWVAVGHAPVGADRIELVQAIVSFICLSALFIPIVLRGLPPDPFEASRGAL